MKIHKDELEDYLESDDTIEKIVFLEIKTGKSQLSKIQKEIKRAVVDKRVEWEVYNPS